MKEYMKNVISDYWIVFLFSLLFLAVIVIFGLEFNRLNDEWVVQKQEKAEFCSTIADDGTVLFDYCFDHEGVICSIFLSEGWGDGWHTMS